VAAAVQEARHGEADCRRPVNPGGVVQPRQQGQPSTSIPNLTRGAKLVTQTDNTLRLPTASNPLLAQHLSDDMMMSAGDFTMAVINCLNSWQWKVAGHVDSSRPFNLLSPRTTPGSEGSQATKSQSMHRNCQNLG